MPNELKPCPFCRGRAELHYQPLYTDNGVCIRCIKCHARSRFILYDCKYEVYNGEKRFIYQKNEQLTMQLILGTGGLTMLNEPFECEYCYDGVCTNADSECRADYCPVIEYPEICKYAKEKIAENMTPMKAWGIISSNLMQLYKMRATKSLEGYTQDDISAEVICFKALQQMKEGADNG